MHFKAILGLLAFTGILIGARSLRNHHMRLFAGLEGFSTRPEFSLLDSLPALSPGLGELEAFKFTADPGAKTNSDRSVWLTDTLREISVEYYSGRSVHDSTRFYVWSTDSLQADTLLRRDRNLRWTIPVRKPLDTWVEVVGVYVSHPRMLDFRPSDTSISAFDQVEGKTLHIVRRAYRDHRERPVRPDTAYPLTRAGEPQLLAKGNSLAILNPSTEPLEIRVIRTTQNRWDICTVAGRTLQIYRGMLRGNTGPVLAYTRPGKARRLIFPRAEVPPLYFWLDR
jgi:hypothetical protein